MLHHVSITAREPQQVAEALATLIGGSVSEFGPQPGGFIAWASDSSGTAIEVYPHGVELHPGEDDDQALFEHSYFTREHTGTHAAISVERSEEEIITLAASLGWRATRQDRGGFDVVEVWVENRTMVEILTREMAREYLDAVKAPRVAAAGEHINSLELRTRVSADAATLFRAWTTSDALREWWPVHDAHIDLRVGGPFELLFLTDGERGEQGSEGCTFLSYVPHRMISFTWSAPPHFPLRDRLTWVVVEFEEGEESTDITLTQAGFLEGPQWQQVHDYFQKAWKRVLRRMVAHWEQDASAVGRSTETTDGTDADPGRADVSTADVST